MTHSHKKMKVVVGSEFKQVEDLCTDWIAQIINSPYILWKINALLSCREAGVAPALAKS